MKYLAQCIFAIGIIFGSTTSAQSKVISSSSDHFTLRHEVVTELTTEQVWDRLIVPSTWWAPDHTYSGKSENLSLELKPGGLWAEKWQSGSVKHGEVIFVKHRKQLRLNAPFGPLQEKAVTDVWTITLTAQENGTLITFDEVATGSSVSKLDELALAVDFVKNEAIKRLAASPK